MIEFIDNAWVVSLSCILVGFAVTPLLQRAGDYIRSRRGPLTGTYIAFAGSGDPQHFTVEVINCRQTGKGLSGTIIGRADLTLDNQGIHIRQFSVPIIYKFIGRVLERQVQAIYWVPEKGSQNGGVIVLEPDANGLVFNGFWGGTGEYAWTGRTLIMDGRYIWFRDRDDIIKTMNDDDFIHYVGQIAGRPGLIPRPVPDPESD